MLEAAQRTGDVACHRGLFRDRWGLNHAERFSVERVAEGQGMRPLLLMLF